MTEPADIEIPPVIIEGTVVVIPVDEWKADRKRTRRRDLVQTGLIVLALAAIAFLVKDKIDSETERKAQATVNQAILEDIARQTSPERARQQEEFLNGVLVKIDCNNRQVTQDAINQLAEQGLVDPIDITAMCNAQGG